MEKCRDENKIKHYGLSSWNSFRVSPKDPNHLSLASLVRLAEKVRGKDHGFKFIQVPVKIKLFRSIL